jgi:hypothetical protein
VISYNTIVAKQASVVTAVILSIGFWMIFAKYLIIVLCLSDETLDYMINLDGNSLISIEKAIVFALASGAFELSFPCKPLLCVFLILDHFSGDTMSACSLSATEHDDGFPRF